MAKYMSLFAILLLPLPLHADLARDPTAPLNASSSSGVAEHFELQAVLKSNRGIAAIVNGYTVKMGEKVNGWTVANIQDHSVTLSKAGKTQHKTLRGSILK